MRYVNLLGYRLALIMLMLIMVTGCKAQAPLQVDSAIDTTTIADAQSNTTAQIIEDLNAQLNESVKSWYDKVSNMTYEYERKDYSLPDSTGKQHVVSSTSGTMTNKSKEQRKDTTISTVDLSAVQTTIINIDERLQQLEKDVGNTTYDRKATLSGWQKALIWLGSTFVGIIIYVLFCRRWT